jgi:hypothetical protein
MSSEDNKALVRCFFYDWTNVPSARKASGERSPAARLWLPCGGFFSTNEAKSSRRTV